MKFFIDTADLNEIKEAESWGVLSGVTTNPSLYAKTGGRLATEDNGSRISRCRRTAVTAAARPDDDRRDVATPSRARPPTIVQVRPRCLLRTPRSRRRGSLNRTPSIGHGQPCRPGRALQPSARSRRSDDLGDP